MTAGRTLTEEEAANGLYSSLVVALKVAKHACVLDETDLLVGGDEQWLIIYGLSLYFMYSAKFDATLLSIVLPCLEDSDRRLNASTCPPAFRPYFDRWVDLVPRIQPLSEDYTQDLALLICRKPPITLPKELPDPLPFFLTPEQQAREDIRELSSGLRVISNAISEHASFSPLWRGKLYAALREEDQTITDEQIPAVITGDMKVHQIFTILTQHSCRDVTNELDFPSCSIYPSAAGGTHDIYTGRLRDGSLVAIKKPQMRSAYMRDEDYIVRAACGTYTWSEHHHSNVLPLIGLAYSSGELATISPWMRNGNILDYVNKHEPDADRFNLVRVPSFIPNTPER
ncbi:hypothetical protein FRC09_012142 [Ceratobasidium sp. 395]|nr:hypothetical protein FRC09_012142 [Ceratobasidium sp. 395]